MKKRLLAMILVCFMVLGVTPAHASRDTVADESGEFVIQDGTTLVQYSGTASHVVVPEGVEVILGGVFQDCVNMTSITLPETLLRTSSGAVFQGCTGLTEITLPDSMTEIYHGTFEGSSLKRIYLPAHLVDTFLVLPEDCYAVCKDDEIINDCVVDNGTLTQYVGEGGRVVVPDGVTAIAKHAFYERTKVTEVVLPDGLQTIEGLAFSGCTGLTEINIPDSVETIAPMAFFDCSSLAEVTVPSSVTLEFDVLSGYGDLRGVFPKTTNVILAGHHFDVENGVLKGYRGPGGKVVIPEGVTELDWRGGNPLARPEGLGEFTHVVFPSSMATLKSSALKDQRSLTDVTIPASITQIDDKAINSIYYPAAALTVHGAAGSEAEAFAKRNGYAFVADQKWNVGSEALEHRFEVENGVLKSYSGPGGEVVVPKGVTKVTSDVFEKLGSLERLVLPDGVKEVEVASKSLEYIVLPDSVTKLTLRCPKLRELALPEELASYPDLECPSVRKITFSKNNWVFKGISRADLLRFTDQLPMLNTIVNCPNEFVDEVIAANVALRDNWVDPKSTIVPQSERITQLSNQITRGLSGDYDKAKAISQWVVEHIKYDDDYYYEGLKDYSDVPFDPEEILDKGQAVCAGISRLTQALLVVQKIPCLYVLGNTTAGYHAWNLAVIDGEYLWIDNTWGMNYFGVGIYTISREHWATGAASFNNVKGPGTLVEGEKKENNGGNGLLQGGGGSSTTPLEETAVRSVLPEEAGTAHPSAQEVLVDGKKVEFQCYALKDTAGNDTNYIKLRDLADILNGTAAQFEVGWDGKNVTITTGQGYTRNGSEQKTPFSGQRSYAKADAATLIDGQRGSLAAFVLTDDDGGGYTYYQLRELGRALGFNVSWSAEQGIFVESGKPYSSEN